MRVESNADKAIEKGLHYDNLVAATWGLYINRDYWNQEAKD